MHRNLHRTLLAALTSLCLLSACAGPQTISTPVSATGSAVTAQATIKVGQAPHGMWGVKGFVYNSNSAETTVSVIDTASDTVVKTLTLPEGGPSYIKASHSGEYVFVLSPEAGKIYQYAPGKDHALVQTIEVGAGPDRIQLNADDSKAWISLAQEDAVTELSFSQGLDKAPQIRKLATGRNNHTDEHRMLALGLSMLATPNTADNTVSLLAPDKAQNQPIRAGNAPNVVGIGSWDGQDRMLIIGNTTSNTVTLHPLVSGAPVTLSEVGLAPTDIAVDAASGKAFITMAGSNQVAVFDVKAQTLLAKIAVGSRPVHIYQPPALQGEGPGREIWVSNDAGASVTVVDADTLKVKATLAVGKGHHKMAFSGAKAYISNISEGTVSVIDRNQVK